MLVGSSQRSRGLDGQQASLFRFELSFLVDVFVEVAALHVLHGQEVRVIGFAEFIERDDVLVAKLGGVLRFQAKALEHVRPGGQVGRQSLEGDNPSQVRVPRLVDSSHPAGADPLEYLIMADDGPLVPGAG